MTTCGTNLDLAALVERLPLFMAGMVIVLLCLLPFYVVGYWLLSRLLFRSERPDER